VVKIFTILLVLVVSSVFSQSAFAERTGDFAELKILRGILEQDENQLDLAKIKLTVDRLIDPSINIDSELNKIELMVSDIRSMLQPDANAMDKMLAIKKYIYTSGEWNNHQAYRYDFDDPLGTNMPC
jgi:hypothetical protein